MGGDKDLRRRGGLCPVKVRRYFREQVLMRNDEFGMRSATDQAKNALAGLPQTDGRAYLGNFSGKLDAGDFGRESRWRRILALALEEIGAVERGGANTHKDL